MLEVSAGIVIKNGKILCMQRGQSKHDYLTHKYEFPGGKLEKGETALDSLIREFEEELGADLSSSSIEPLGDLTYTYPDFTVKINFFKIFDDEFQFEMKEHAGYVWSEPKDLKNLDWAAADLEILDRLLK